MPTPGQMTCQFRDPASGDPCGSDATRVVAIYYPERERQVVNRYCDEHADVMVAELEGDPNRQLVSDYER